MLIGFPGVISRALLPALCKILHDGHVTRRNSATLFEASLATVMPAHHLWENSLLLSLNEAVVIEATD